MLGEHCARQPLRLDATDEAKEDFRNNHSSDWNISAAKAAAGAAFAEGICW